MSVTAGRVSASGSLTPEPGRWDESRRHGGRPRILVLMLALALAAGLLTAAVATPLVLGAGLAAKASADHFESLPTTLPDIVFGRDSTILAADGSLIATLHGAENRVPVKISQISKVMQTAIVDIEDSRFYSHHGIDFKGLVRAAVEDSGGTATQGGSTITQQYVKNLLLFSADSKEAAAEATDKSVARKLKEARLALALEQRESKQQILEGYLNIAYFGHGAYGIGAAAMRYFGTTVNRLTLAQSALLAGLVQSPSADDPIAYPKAAIQRRSEVLQRMRELGHITAAQQKLSNAAGLHLHPVAPPATADPCLNSQASFYCSWVIGQLSQDKALGATQTARSQRLDEGGLTIKTTLDPSVQAAAQAALDQTVEQSNSITLAEAIVQPGTGKVLAMAVNKPYGTNKALGQTTIPILTRPTLQPGSTFKTITLTTALYQGLPLSTSFNSPACYVSQLYKFGNGNNGTKIPEPGCANGVSNASDSESGTFDMVQGTWQSVNTYYVQLEEKVGVLNVRDMAVRLGIPAARFPTTGQFAFGPGSGSLTIGGYAMSPLDMATAYATLAAHGLRCPSYGAVSATGVDGKPVALTPPAPCEQVIPQTVADTVTSVLEGVITNGTGSPNASLYGRPAAGKTGTTDDYTAAWFVGYTPQLAAAVEAGYISAPGTTFLTNVSAGGRYYSQVFGGDIPALAWSRTLTTALANQPWAPMPAPAGG
jgi:membrane peptidoglycan carboxypeptidase